MLISCLMPTYNRMPGLRYIVEEALYSFAIQEQTSTQQFSAELLILNDTPNQTIHCHHPKVKVFNLPQRMANLSDKLQFLIDQAQGDYLTRWDDDDISLPWRLSLSAKYIADMLEWHPENHWYREGLGDLKQTIRPGNVGNMSIFHRSALTLIGGFPPERYGDEDQEFIRLVKSKITSRSNCVLPPEEIFYIYRWGLGAFHLSGMGGGNRLQESWKRIGEIAIAPGSFTLVPNWRESYTNICRRAVTALGWGHTRPLPWGTQG